MSPIRKSVEFAAPIGRVWAWLTESEKINAWLMPNTFRAEVGARFTMDCPPGVGSGAPIACEVRECVPPAAGRARLVYTWVFDRPPPLSTLLEIDLEEAGGTTRLRLVHSGWEALEPDEAFVRDRHDKGWDMRLGTMLRGFVEQ